uniref:Uncharacterized protein n=1 Tax=Haptolina brevifila TaxID=156173 RepID=A0A7S2NPG3_9EUKA
MASLLSQLIDGNLIKAMFVFFGTPLFICYLCIAALNQTVRKTTSACGIAPILPDNDRPLVLTRLAHDQCSALSHWAWSSILLKVHILGLLAWGFLYGSTLTYMGLAALIAFLRTVHWLVASIIFFITGLSMFLLPPVPGLAVYLCAGVLLTPACEDTFGYLGACAYSASLAFAMKLVAQVCQQKMIGERLGSSTQVKAMVGVNTDLIKSIRKILEQPGLSLAKVSILCGGPDWPTAVLCGILGLEVRQMLIGLLPIFMLTIPTSLSGAFELRAEEAGLWGPLATMMLLIAALVQLILGVLALYFIEQVKLTYELGPDDEDVAKVEAEEAEFNAAFNAATRLEVMPLGTKLLLFSSTTVLVASAYLLIFTSGLCFEEFALTDDIWGALCLSCERAAIKPLGWVALGMLSYSVICLLLFNRLANKLDPNPHPHTNPNTQPSLPRSPHPHFRPHPCPKPHPNRHPYPHPNSHPQPYLHALAVT